MDLLNQGSMCSTLSGLLQVLRSIELACWFCMTCSCFALTAKDSEAFHKIVLQREHDCRLYLLHDIQHVCSNHSSDGCHVCDLGDASECPLASVSQAHGETECAGAVLKAQVQSTSLQISNVIERLPTSAAVEAPPSPPPPSFLTHTPTP